MSIYLLSESTQEGVISMPLIEVVYREIQIDLSGYDALLFTSKNGVRAIDKINKHWQKIPSYAIGEGTACSIESLGGLVAYTAKSSYGDSFALELLTILQNKKVLFCRAKEVLSNLEDILTKGGIALDCQVVYETHCKLGNLPQKLHKNAVIIFTSPSTIKCFFKVFAWDESYKAVCIGQKTAAFLPKNISTLVSSQQSIAHCVALAKTL